MIENDKLSSIESTDNNLQKIQSNSNDISKIIEFLDKLKIVEISNGKNVYDIFSNLDSILNEDRNRLVDLITAIATSYFNSNDSSESTYLLDELKKVADILNVSDKLQIEKAKLFAKFLTDLNVKTKVSLHNMSAQQMNVNEEDENGSSQPRHNLVNEIFQSIIKMKDQ